MLNQFYFCGIESFLLSASDWVMYLRRKYLRFVLTQFYFHFVYLNSFTIKVLNSWYNISWEKFFLFLDLFLDGNYSSHIKDFDEKNQHATLHLLLHVWYKFFSIFRNFYGSALKKEQSMYSSIQLPLLMKLQFYGIPRIYVCFKCLFYVWDLYCLRRIFKIKLET